MSKLEFSIWLIAFVIMLSIIIYRNKKFAAALNEVQGIIDESRSIVKEELAVIRNPNISKSKKNQAVQMIENEKFRIEHIFQHVEKWPSQSLRIRRYLKESEEYVKEAKGLFHQQ